MAMEFYALSDRAVRQFKQLLNEGTPTGQKQASIPSPRLMFCKLTEAAPAAAADELTKAESQLYSWDANDDPGSLGINNLNTVEVWNPHDVEIPSGTLCIIGKFPNGWVIITPVNWCPSA